MDERMSSEGGRIKNYIRKCLQRLSNQTRCKRESGAADHYQEKNLIKESCYYLNDELQTYTVYQYDEKKELKTSYYEIDNELRSCLIRSYDEEGNLVEVSSSALTGD